MSSVCMQVLMQPFFESLFELPVFHVCERGGVNRWAHVTGCLFDCMHRVDVETRSLVISTLLDAGVNVAVDVRPHLLLALGAFGKHAPETIEPAIVRAHLRQSPTAYECLPQMSKLRILSFILKDNDFQDLAGIRLLPVLDGSFTQFFRKNAAERIYLTTAEFPAHLLPTLEKLLVSAMDIDDDLHEKLRKIAQSGKCNIWIVFECSLSFNMQHRHYFFGDIIAKPICLCLIVHTYAMERRRQRLRNSEHYCTGTMWIMHVGCSSP